MSLLPREDRKGPFFILGIYLPKPEWFDWRQWKFGPWADVAQGLWAGKEYKFEPRNELSAKAISNHLNMCIASLEPKHEHKIAGMALLLALWTTLEWPEELREAAKAWQADADAWYKERGDSHEWELEHP